MRPESSKAEDMACYIGDLSWNTGYI